MICGVGKLEIPMIFDFAKESHCKLVSENLDPNSQIWSLMIYFDQISSKIRSKTMFEHRKVLPKSKPTNRAAYCGETQSSAKNNKSFH